jgi:hypothetical protein
MTASVCSAAHTMDEKTTTPRVKRTYGNWARSFASDQEKSEVWYGAGWNGGLGSKTGRTRLQAAETKKTQSPAGESSSSKRRLALFL